MKKITKTEEYIAVIEEIQAAIVECRKMALEAVLQVKWAIGDAVVSHGMEERIPDIARDVGISEQEIGRCVNFRSQWPGENYFRAVEAKPLPDGDATSWRRMVNIYLPQKSYDKQECQHLETLTITICKKCGKRMK